MRTETQTIRIGENVGPVDWNHPLAKNMPAHWRDAEKSPEHYEILLNGMMTPRRVFCLCMYDGWPYWRPMPAILREGPLGAAEWLHFNSYGVTPNSLRSIPTSARDGETG